MMLKRKTFIAATVLAVLFILAGTAYSQNQPDVTRPPDSSPPVMSYAPRGACCPDGESIIPPGEMCVIVHPVGAGENLHILSAYYYGDARAWRRIYNANRDKIKNPNVIYEGQNLLIEVPPCWVPRYDLSVFMAIEAQRREVLSKPMREQKVIERQETVTPSIAPLTFGEEDAETTPAPGGAPAPVGVPAIEFSAPAEPAAEPAAEPTEAPAPDEGGGE